MKHVRKSLSFILALVVLCATLFSSWYAAYAATPDGKYVEEIILVNGDTEKKKAEDDGYYVYATPIYEEGSQKTYMAVKTTNDPRNAVTDIRTMSMNGGWSVDEYEKAIKAQKELIGKLVDNTWNAVLEFRKNYASANERIKAVAKHAYDALNSVYDDDYMVDDTPNDGVDNPNPKTALLGDIFLKESFQKADLQKILLQCCQEAYVIIFDALSIACKYNEDGLTILDIIGDIDFDPEEYREEIKYNSYVSTLVESLPTLQETIKLYTESGYMSEDGRTDEEIAEYASKLPMEKQERFMTGKRFYEVFNASPYYGYAVETVSDYDEEKWGKGFYVEELEDYFQYESFYQLIMKYDLSKEKESPYKYEDFNPIVAVMTDGQRALLEIGIQQILGAVVSTDETLESSVSMATGTGLYGEVENAEEKEIPEFFKKYDVDIEKTEYSEEEMKEALAIGDVISIYTGINREVFSSNDIAITTKSLRNAGSAEDILKIAKDDKENAELLQKKADALKYTMIGLSAGALVTGGVAIAFFCVASNLAPVVERVAELSAIAPEMITITEEMCMDMLVLNMRSVAAGGDVGRVLSVFDFVNLGFDRYAKALPQAFVSTLPEASRAEIGISRALMTAGVTNDQVRAMRLAGNLRTTSYQSLKQSASFAKTASSVSKGFAVLGTICLIALIVVGIVFSSIELAEKETVLHADYKRIPLFMCAQEGALDENGKMTDARDMFYYEAAKNPYLTSGEKVVGVKVKEGAKGDKLEDYEETQITLDNDNKAMDIYNWTLTGERRQWVAVYSSKDSRLGKPILADSFTFSNMAGIHKICDFEGASQNMYGITNIVKTQNKYLYVSYSWDSSYKPISSVGGSIFADGKNWAFGAGGLAIGLAAGGIVIGIMKSKQYRKEEQA